MKGRVFPRPYKLVDGERRPIKGKSTWTFEHAVQRGGRRKFVTKGGFRTKADAETALAASLSEFGRDPGREVQKPSTMTLRRFVTDEWLPALANLKPSTVKNYTDLVNAYVLPHLGDHRMCDVTPGNVAKLYATLRTSGRCKGTGGVSESTVHHAHVVVGKVFRYAVETGALVTSPVTRLPRDSRPVQQQPDPAKLRVWTRDQVITVLRSTASDRHARLWRFAIDSGARRGELAAVRWPDLDLDAGLVTIRRNRVVVGKWTDADGGVIEGTPKTKHGQRTFDLDPATVAALKRHQVQQKQERLAWGMPWDANGLVFTREDGAPLHPETIADALASAVVATNTALKAEHDERTKRGERVDLVQLPWIGVHGLRHTCATLGLRAGVPLKVMSERLGHSSTTITADLYQHVVPGMQADAAKAIMGGLG